MDLREHGVKILSAFNYVGHGVWRAFVKMVGSIKVMINLCWNTL
jgi:hypothetical protein